MKPFALARVLQLAERQIEKQAREVKLAHGVWLRARGRQVQLTALRDAHIAQLAAELRGGVAADHLLEKSRLQRMRADEMRAAQRDIDEAYRVWQAQLAIWMSIQKRVRALQLLEERYQAHAVIQNRRLEQRQHDELVELMHGRVAPGRRAH
ncbi:MAG: flagellar FliJ family protein [Thiobacillus sp.]|nr:flagellar FliJ family protein [Thiobacillus sp.]